MSDKARIPAPLKKEGFRFIKVAEGQKRPLEKNWQKNNNYKFNDPEIVEHLHNGGNYGVLGGKGNLVIIDCDKEKAAEKVREKLPHTLTIRSGSGEGWHFYYICPDLDEPIRLSDGNDAGDVGDVQSKGKMAVGPNSLHPSGNRYEVDSYSQIKEVEAKDIIDALKEFIVDYSGSEKNREMEKNLSDGKVFPISQVVDLSDLKKRGSEFQGSHPVHGSGTGMNFCVNTEKGIWHCFRHDTGGGPLSWIAVKEGIIDCEEATKGSKKIRENFSEILEVAEEKYDVDTVKYGYKRIGFNEDGKFKPGLFGKYLVDKHEFLTLEDSEQLFAYEDGFWKPKGEQIVKREFNSMVEPEEYNKNRLKSVISFVKTSNYVERKYFRPPTTKVNLENGVFDIENQELLEHDKEYNFVFKINRRFDEEAECPEIDKFIRSLVETEEEVEKIYEMIGYIMVCGNPVNKAFMLAGNGKNGKTVLIDLIKEALGDKNVKKLSLQSLQNDFDKHFLYSKLLMFHDDLPPKPISSDAASNLKSLTGNSTFSAEIKFGDRYDFKPYATPVFAANEVPPTRDETDGFFRRWVFIEFPYSFEKYPDEDKKYEKQLEKYGDLMDRMCTEEELNGLITRALRKAGNVLEENGFTGSLSIPEKRVKWMEHSTPVESFIHRFVSQGRTKGDDKRLKKSEGDDADWSSWSHDYVRKDDLYNLVCAYASVRGGNKPSMKRLTSVLLDSELDVGTTRTTRDPDSISDRGGRVPVYTGIRLDLVRSEVPHYFESLPHQESNQSLFIRDSREDGFDLSKGSFKKKLSDLDSGDGVAVGDLKSCFDVCEEDFDDFVKRMEHQGVVFEPRPGKLKRL